MRRTSGTIDVLSRRLMVDGCDLSDRCLERGDCWDAWCDFRLTTSHLFVGGKRATLALLLVVLLPIAAAAQVGPDAAVRDALAWTPDHQHTADVISTALVGVALAAPCLRDRRWRCVADEGLRVGLGLSVTELVKRVTHRTRPNGADQKSFFSGHTLLACVATVRTTAWALCPAVGYLRIAADQHWTTDVATGAAAGALLTTIAWGR